MKILQVIQHFQLGGLEKMVLDLVANSSTNHQFHIVALEGNLNDVLEQWPGLAAFSGRLHCLDKPAEFSPSTILALRRLIRELNIDCIHSHHVGPLFYGALAGALSRRTFHITTLHDAWYLKNSRYKWLTRCIEKLTKVTFVADAVAVAETATNLAAIKVEHVILNGIDTHRFIEGDQVKARQFLNLPVNKFIVGSAARLEPGKGHESLIRQLSNMDSNVCLAFAGGGSLAIQLQNLAQELQLEDRIFWLGKMDQIDRFYNALSCFCLFSENEGLPLAILEALSSGIPVVASNVGGIPEIVNSGNGILIEHDDGEALAKTFQSLSHFAKYKNIRANVEATADVSRMVSQYESLYQSIA